jgi:predicted GIY-YIG superfamily endonuclease
MYYVYWIKLPEHTNLVEEGYVGITNDIGKRFRAHEYSSQTGDTHFYRAVRLYGWENLEKCIIASVKSKEEVNEIERLLRPNHNIGWNIAIGGQNQDLSEESKLKISLKLKGKIQPPEVILKRVQKNLGKKRTEQQKKNLSEGLKKADGTKAKYLITHPDGREEIVFGLKPWCKANGFSAARFFELASGRKPDKTTGKSKWDNYSCKKLTPSCEQKVVINQQLT